MTDLFSDVNTFEDGHIVNFCAKFHKPDYGIMHLVCLDSTEKTYKVIVNESDIKYVSKIDNGSFWTWEKYILNSIGINAKHPLTLSIKDNPKSNASTIDSTGNMNSYCANTISGDWINIRYSCLYENDIVEECFSAKNCSKTGWIKWRNENELLIAIYLMP